MLQFLKTKNFDEVVSDIKISKVVFTCIMLIMAIFAGISCQINQTEQNAAYVKKYLASKKGYYSNLVSNMRRAATEKYYGSSSKAEDFSSYPESEPQAQPKRRCCFYAAQISQ